MENLEKLESELMKDLNEIVFEEKEQKRNEHEPEDPLVAMGFKEKEEKKRKVPEPKADLLLTERINAKLFQHKLKRAGVALSLWEVFTLFDHLNMHVAKSNMFRPTDAAESNMGASNVLIHEPQRYHFAMWEHFWALVCGSDVDGPSYRQSVNAKMGIKQTKAKKGGKKKRNRRRRQEDSEEAMSLAESLNADSDESVDDDDYSSDEAVASPRKGRNDKRPYKQAKHIFEINVKELKNIPILAKFIREAQDYNKAMVCESRRLMDGRYLSHQNEAHDLMLDAQASDSSFS